MSEKAMVLCSGGVDSTTCLALAIEKHGKENVCALSIYYGQKHVKEIQAAKAVLEYYGIEGTSLDLTPVFAYSDCGKVRCGRHFAHFLLRLEAVHCCLSFPLVCMGENRWTSVCRHSASAVYRCTRKADTRERYSRQHWRMR